MALFDPVTFLYLSNGKLRQTLEQLRVSHRLSANTIAKAVAYRVLVTAMLSSLGEEASFIAIFRICRFYEISLQEFANIVDPHDWS